MKKGQIMTTKQKEKIRLSNLGKKRSQESRDKMKKPKSESHKKKLSLAHTGEKHSEERRKKKSESQRGSKSHFWKGGLTKINKLIRSSLEYKLWRDAVFQRDNYTCVWCGTGGIELNADHIKPFAQYPELRFAIDSGRTLCRLCHLTTETWGNRSNKINNE